MQEIYIVGAGGFGREVQWLIERINAISNEWNIKGFIDDGRVGLVNDYPIVDTVDGFIQKYGNSANKIAVLGGIDKKQSELNTYQGIKVSHNY